jgi:hypothetical protein
MASLIACWILKSRNTHSEYVTGIACPLQHWLQERASMLHYGTVHGPFVATGNSNISKYIFEVTCTRRWGYKLCNYFITYFFSENYFFPIYLCALLSVINCGTCKFRTPRVVSICVPWEGKVEKHSRDIRFIRFCSNNLFLIVQQSSSRNVTVT